MPTAPRNAHARFAFVLIENGFDVDASVDAAWALLEDVPRVVPCMPGATLERTIDDSTWEVLQRVKLGPISLQFRTEVRRTSSTRRRRRATLAIKAREVRGRGGAEATIRSALSTVDGEQRVDIATELTLQGAVAQYGRPVVGSVAEELTRGSSPRASPPCSRATRRRWTWHPCRRSRSAGSAFSFARSGRSSSRRG